MENKVRIVLCGKEFNLQTSDSPSHFLEVAKELNHQIDEFMEENPGLSTQSACLLTALDAYDYRKKADDVIDNIRVQITQYVNEAEEARNERDKAIKERDELQKEVETLKTKLTCYETAERINNKNNSNKKK